MLQLEHYCLPIVIQDNLIKCILFPLGWNSSVEKD